MANRGSFVTFMLILGLSLVAGFYLVAPYLLSLLVGGILTLIMNPLYQWLRRRKIGPRWSATITTLSMIVGVLGPFLVFAAIGIRQAISISQWILGNEHVSLQEYLLRISTWGPLQYFSIDAAELAEHLREILQRVGTISTQFVLNLARSIPQGVLQLILACFTCYCLLIDGRRFMEWVFGKIPMNPEIRDRIGAAFKNTAISVVLASMAAAGTQSLVMLFAFWVLGVPNAFLAGGATFILAWIPIVGSTPVWLGATVFLYLQEAWGGVLMMIGFGVITGTIDNFVRPMVLKGRGEMHPLVSLVAIFGGLQLFGLFGVFLGPIIAAIVISLLQIWPAVGQPFGLVFAADQQVAANKKEQ